MAYASALQRTFQEEYGSSLRAPLSATTSVAGGHRVTQRSVERSWANLTSPLRTGGRTPNQYSQVVQQDFAQNTEDKRLRELATSTASVRKSLNRSRSAAAAAASASASSSQQDIGGRAGIPRAAAARGGPTSRATGRPVLSASERPRLEKPVRSFPGGRQRYDYQRHSSSYSHIPNPAVDPPLTHAALLQTFPWATRSEHHMHPINRVDGSASPAGYYSTHWDDPYATNPYTRHQVEVINTARPADLAAAAAEAAADASATDGNGAGLQQQGPLFNRPDLSSPTAPSPDGAKYAATSLGFGKRHADYRQYVYARPHANLTLEASGPVARAAHAQNRIVVPLPPHLLEHLPAPELRATATGATTNNLALAVPFNLARFVPVDERDGQGKGGHFLAAGLGYGKGNRNYNKYLQPNVEGHPELAYFRAQHCT